jgi:hypothetical protein
MMLRTVGCMAAPRIAMGFNIAYFLCLQQRHLQPPLLEQAFQVQFFLKEHSGRQEKFVVN